MERRIKGQQDTHPRVVDPSELMKLFSRYHEGGQVGSVDGKEYDSEHGPDVGHKSGKFRGEKWLNIWE